MAIIKIAINLNNVFLFTIKFFAIVVGQIVCNLYWYRLLYIGNKGQMNERIVVCMKSLDSFEAVVKVLLMNLKYLNHGGLIYTPILRNVGVLLQISLF